MDTHSLITLVNLALGILSTVFSVGFYLGYLRARLFRMRIDLADLKKAYKIATGRDFVSKFPEKPQER